MDIAPPPLWQHLLLESPWLLAGAMLVAALLLRYVARQRSQPAVGYGAFGLAVAAGGVIALAYMVTTDRELVEQQTHELIAATVSPGDFTTLDRLLASDAVLTGSDGTVWLEVAAIRRELEGVLDRYRIEDQVVRDIGAEVTSATTARSAFDLRTHSPSGPGLPVRSMWTLHWQREENDGSWRVVRIQCDEFMGQPQRQRFW